MTNGTFPLPALSPEAARRTITLQAPSKTYNIPGLGCSFAVIAHEELQEPFFRRAMAGIVPHVNLLGYTAALAAYRERGEPWQEVAAGLSGRGNRELVLAGEVAANARPADLAGGGHLPGLRFSTSANSAWPSPAAHFEAHGLGLSDGADFGVTRLAAPQFRLRPRHARMRRSGASPTACRAASSPYALTVLALRGGADCAQTVARRAGDRRLFLRQRAALRRPAAPGWRSPLRRCSFALHQGYALELAVRYRPPRPAPRRFSPASRRSLAGARRATGLRRLGLKAPSSR